MAFCSTFARGLVVLQLGLSAFLLLVDGIGVSSAMGKNFEEQRKMVRNTQTGLSSWEQNKVWNPGPKPFPQFTPLKEEPLVVESSFRQVAKNHSFGRKDRQQQKTTGTIILAEIYLDDDRPNIAGQVGSILDYSLTHLEPHTKWTITVGSHCDRRGETGYSVMVGYQRARQVANFMENLGFPPERLQVLTEGKTPRLCQEHHARCWEERARTQGTFQYMAFRGTKLGCLIRLGVQSSDLSHLATLQTFAIHKPYLQKIVVAEPRTAYRPW